jgi:hypothetical protein
MLSSECNAKYSVPARGFFPAAATESDMHLHSQQQQDLAFILSMKCTKTHKDTDNFLQVGLLSG